jgi:hypothetical protein
MVFRETLVAPYFLGKDFTYRSILQYDAMIDSVLSMLVMPSGTLSISAL